MYSVVHPLTPVICAVTVYAPKTTARTEMKCAVKKMNRKGMVTCIFEETFSMGAWDTIYHTKNIDILSMASLTSSALKNGTIAMAYFMARNSCSDFGFSTPFLPQYQI